MLPSLSLVIGIPKSVLDNYRGLRTGSTQINKSGFPYSFNISE
ncbi:MAG: hypothetical protein ACI97N_001736 [Cognaticolwellia sp.]|jgi:hypothetical protein